MNYTPTLKAPEVSIQKSSPLEQALGKHEAIDNLKRKFFPREQKEVGPTIYGVGPRRNIY